MLEIKGLDTNGKSYTVRISVEDDTDQLLQDLETEPAALTEAWSVSWVQIDNNPYKADFGCDLFSTYDEAYEVYNARLTKRLNDKEYDEVNEVENAFWKGFNPETLDRFEIMIDIHVLKGDSEE